MNLLSKFLLVIISGLSGCSVSHVNFNKIIHKRLSQSTYNLIPDSAGTTPGYYCTWGVQGFAASHDTNENAFGISGHSLHSEKLSQDLIFGKQGAAWAYDKIRKDLFILYDLGWDIDPGVNIEKAPWQKGRLLLSGQKFPGCKGTPAEQLRALDEMTKKAGWKGAGFWVAAEPYEYGKNGKKQSLEEIRLFFENRAALFNEAGIKYWKVDYGALKGDVAFRKIISEVAKKYAPGLFVENCNVDGPLNDEDCPWCGAIVNNTSRFKNWNNGIILKNALAMLSFSPVYRTYDVSPLLSPTTTLDRVASLLAEYDYPQTGGLLNCEDEPCIAAALGCAPGIMRHPIFSKENNFDEVIRAVRWQRIAPAFRVTAGETKVDTTILTDEYIFKEGETWADWTYGKIATQKAPARVARRMNLPKVIADSTIPYVICSQNPSGAITVVTIPRLAIGKKTFYPLADVTIQATNFEKPIGIFGVYKSLSIEFETLPGKFKIFAQDLAGDKAIDISDLVKHHSNTITIDGDLLTAFGTMEGTPGDLSAPGLLISIK